MNPARSQPEADAAHDRNEFVRQFVVLEHDFPFLHWDYLIEDGNSLASWRLMERPAQGVTTLATRLDNHRRHYLTYEGPVSGDRGTVRRLHTGELRLQSAWPASDNWCDLKFTILDSELSDRCMLAKRDDREVWSFI